MMAGQVELAADVSVATEAGIFDGARRINGLVRTETGGGRSSRGEAKGRFDLAARLGVKAAGTMTGFAARGQGVWPLGDQAGVVGGNKVATDLFMALFAFFGADVIGSWHVG